MVRKVKTMIGWEEWCALPGLGLPAVKAKIDTGAKTSALHAYKIRAFEENGQSFVRFKIHPLQRNNKLEVTCVAPLIDERGVTSSNGEHEVRYVIRTPMVFKNVSFEAELTLTSRHNMAFRMLLGREAIRRAKFTVDPAKSFLLGKIADPKALYK